MKNIFFGVMLLFFGLTFELQSQKLPSGPQVLTFHSDVDDTEQPYGLYLPENYDSQKKYPLVVMLHGAGSNHRLSLKRVFGKSNLENETDVEASRYFPDLGSVDYIVVSPYARGTAGYQGIPEKDVYDALEDAKRRFSVDEDRIYLTGLSMGGGGSLWLGMTRPDIWAAIAPVCPAPPQGTDALAMNAFNYPVHLFHGAADPVVPVQVSRDWFASLKALGAKVEYSEFPGVLHDSWVPAYENGYIFDWFRKFKRNAFPDEIKFATKHYKYNKAYWVQLGSFTPGTLASVHATFTSPNSLTINTTALEALTLNLKDHPKFSSDKNLVINIDGKKLSVKGKNTISLLKGSGGWKEGVIHKSSEVKQKGQEGPISEAFAARHVYVYGTLDNPSQEELMKRIDIAKEAANWSVYRGEFLGRYMVFPRILSDKELRASDYDHSNLILFGTKETNAVIAEHSGYLPMHLKSQSDSLGLIYVYPLNGKYLIISSGLPWWKYTPQAGSFNFLPSNISMLSNFKDYAFFGKKKGEKLTEGYFNNKWELTGEAKKVFEEKAEIEID